LSDNEKIEALTELLKKNEEWDKKFKHLKESDFTPAQWKRMQEIKEKIKVTVN
jgi:trehalose-6-phosphate synthase